MAFRKWKYLYLLILKKISYNVFTAVLIKFLIQNISFPSEYADVQSCHRHFRTCFHPKKAGCDAGLYFMESLSLSLCAYNEKYLQKLHIYQSTTQGFTGYLDWKQSDMKPETKTDAKKTIHSFVFQRNFRSGKYLK